MASFREKGRRGRKGKKKEEGEEGRERWREKGGGDSFFQRKEREKRRRERGIGVGRDGEREKGGGECPGGLIWEWMKPLLFLALLNPEQCSTTVHSYINKCIPALTGVPTHYTHARIPSSNLFCKSWFCFLRVLTFSGRMLACSKQQ